MIDEHFLDICNDGFAIGVGCFKSNNIDLLTTYSADWQNQYFDLGGLTKDPVVAFGTQYTGLHHWTNDAPSNDFLAAARDHNLHHGLAFSTVIAGNRLIAGISRQVVFTDAEKAVIQTLLREYHLNKLCQRMLHLSPTQKILVQLTAQGFRAKEIAFHFNVSEATIKQRKSKIQDIIGINNFTCITSLAARAGFAFNPIN
ncbi:autoinducer binding domain-containing protein [Pseudovibrio sp. POLY-S9]|uniref:helix-turn-helix transcriptional regulator n=1 Tax=Pseudovibrio sp. POLY-S9 TaxID=1576596 RepID=UPI00070958CF|nr:autoinducer binding domain-containing protein [Pseudovibrio sp. POLY-S9]